MKQFLQSSRHFAWVFLLFLTTATGWGQISESFESGLPSSYNSSLNNATLNSGTWQIRDVISGTLGVQTGTKSAQIRSATAAQIITPTILGGLGTVSFYVTSSVASGGYQVNLSSDNGATWTPATGSPFSIGTTKTLRTIIVNDANVNKIQIYRTAGTIYIDDFSTTLIPGLVPPTLTAALGATVDAPFDVTFTDDATWRGAITGITIGGTALTAGYTVSAGKITFTPSASNPAGLLQTSGTKSIVVTATGYSNATVSQAIGAGLPSTLTVSTPLAAPTSSGGVFATMPAVTVKDQYNNAVSGVVVNAAVTSGQSSSWTLGGASQTATTNASGVATFSTLTATNITNPSIPYSTATLTFTPATGTGSVASASFTVPGISPTLTAAVGATVDTPFAITFTDNATWRSAITSITVGGTTLSASAYSTTTAGQITFTPSASALLQSAGSKSIVIVATGYASASLTQSIGVGAPNKLVMNIQPTAPSVNGGVLATQPKVNIVDQYGNLTSSTASITASATQGTWTLGGTTDVSAISGTTTFVGLTATSATAITGATITFTSSGLTSVTSGTFNIPSPPPTNDNCSGAIALVMNASAVTGNVASATQSLAAFCAGTADDDVWYSFTTAHAGNYTITVVGSTSFDAVVDLRSGSCNGTNVSCADATASGGTEVISASLAASTTYYVRVYSFGGTMPSTTTFTIGVTSPVLTAPVANAATNVGSDSFTANWNAVLGATSHDLDIFTISQPAQDIFNQNFNLITGTGGNDNLWSGSISSNTLAVSDLSNWTIVSGYKGNNCVKVGTGSTRGSLQTPTLGLSGNAILTFRAGAWSGDSTQLLLEITGGGSLEVSSVNMINSSFLSYTVAIFGGTANTKITFKAKQSSNSRFFLDDVKVTIPAIESPITGSPFNVVSPTVLYTITNLNPVTNYFYRVRAKDSYGVSSSNSNTISVTTYADISTADFRSKANGDFNSLATWEYNTGVPSVGNSGWLDATSLPSGNNNITILASHEVTLTQNEAINSGATLTVNGILNTSTFALQGAGNLTIANGGTLKIGNLHATDAYAAAVGISGTTTLASGSIVELNGAAQQFLGANTFSGLTINNASGVKATGNITVNGTLNLATANPNVTDGALDMVIAYGTYATVSKSEPDNYNSTLPHNNLDSYVLNLGAAATVTGIGDVTGKVTREHAFVSGTTYAFSHPNMTLSFTDLGTLGNLPSRITVIATRGAEGLHVDKDAADNGNPAIGGPAVQRLWQILRGGTQIGSAEDRFSVKFPYTDLELNDNTEGDLVTWDHHLENPAYDGVTPHEHGKTNNNTTDNFVELANHGMFYLAEEGSESRTKYWMLSNKVSTYDSVWLGAVDIPFLSTTNWNIASNWTGGNIPDATDNVYIPDASTTPHDPVISEGSILIDQLLGSLLGNVGMKTLEIGTGGVLTVASGTNPTLTIFGGPNSSGGGNNFGSWINNGTFVPANSKVVFNSSLTASGATIAGTTQFHDLSILLNETVTIQEDAEISIKGKFINLGTLNATTDANTFVFNGTTNQTIPATSSDNNTAAYHHLELSGSGAKSFEGTPSIQGNLIKSGTSSVVIPSQFNFNGATAQSIAGFDYNNIEFSGTGIKTFTSNGSLSNAGAITFSGTPGAVDFDGATDNLTFVLKSDASGTARIGNATDWTLSGKVTSERFVPSRRAWRLLTAPIKGTTNTSIFANWQGTNNEGILLWNPNGGGATGLEVGPQSNIFSYNGGWAAVNNTNTTPLFGAIQNNAFLVFATGPHGSANITPGADPTTPATATTLRPKGGLITGTVTTTLTANQFQLIGNPYASALDTEALIGSNPDAKIWMLDPTLGSFGGYVTYDGTNWAPSTPVAADKNIQSGQAFFVRSTSTLFSIGETHKVISSSNNWFERDNSASTADKIRVLLYKQESGNWKLADGVLSVHSSVGNDAVDAADANKISNFNENIAFRNGATNLAIEYRGMPEAGTQQPLRMTGTTAQPYQLRVRTEGYVNSTLQPYLEDTASGTLTAIPTDGSDLIVSFTGIVATTSTPDNRFRIVYPATLGLDDLSTTTVRVYPNPITDGTFSVVLHDATTPAHYSLVNVMGQEVQSGALEALHNTVAVGSLQQGIYLLQVHQEGKVFTTKLILK